MSRRRRQPGLKPGKTWNRLFEIITKSKMTNILKERAISARVGKPAEGEIIRWNTPLIKREVFQGPTGAGGDKPPPYRKTG